jgi:hypothetical protein
VVRVVDSEVGAFALSPKRVIQFKVARASVSIEVRHFVTIVYDYD